MEFEWHTVASFGITPKQNCIGTSIFLYQLQICNTTYLDMFMALNEKKFKKNLEENGKLNSISYTLKIEMIAHFYHLSLRKSFSALKIMRKNFFFFAFQGSKTPT